MAAQSMSCSKGVTFSHSLCKSFVKACVHIKQQLLSAPKYVCFSVHGVMVAFASIAILLLCLRAEKLEAAKLDHTL